MFLIKSNLSNSIVMIFTFVLLFLYISDTQAFQCYVCDSKNDVECTEDLPSDSKLVPQDCHKINEPKYCIKTTNIFAGEFGTKRFCASNDYGNYCKYVRQPTGDREYRSCVYTCDTPGCNRSSKLMDKDTTLSSVTLSIVIILTLLHLVVQY